MKTLCTYLAAFFLTLWVFLTALFSVGLNDEIYNLAQMRSGVTEESSSVTTEERLALNQDVAKYLSGRSDSIDGLSERAQAHMQDVRALLNGVRVGMYVLMGLTLVFAVLSEKTRLPRAFVRTAGGVIAVCAAVGIFAATRFRGMFEAFHRLFFDNDLWLLNPAEDALIRVMPEKFFMNMALGVGISSVLRCLLACAILYMIRLVLKGRRTEDELRG